MTVSSLRQVAHCRLSSPHPHRSTWHTAPHCTENRLERRLEKRLERWHTAPHCTENRLERRLERLLSQHYRIEGFKGTSQVLLYWRPHRSTWHTAPHCTERDRFFYSTALLYWGVQDGPLIGFPLCRETRVFIWNYHSKVLEWHTRILHTKFQTFNWIFKMKLMKFEINWISNF